MSSEHVARLLLALFRHRVQEPDAEAGLDRLTELMDGAPREALILAVADALAAGYIHDPVRLPPGALQCHWHLDLTARGVEAARRLRSER